MARKVNNHDLDFANIYVKSIGANLKYCKMENYGGGGGSYLPKDNTIRLDEELLDGEAWIFYSLLFHEAGHHYAYSHGKYKVYHTMKTWQNMSQRELRIFCQTAKRAELWCDQFMLKEMKRFCPAMKISINYGSHESFEFLTEHIKPFSLQLKLLTAKKKLQAKKLELKKLKSQIHE